MKNFKAIGRIAAYAAATAMIATSPSFAMARDPEAKQEDATKANRKEKQQYCVNEEITGSRMPRKVCKTRAEWISQDGFDPREQR